MALNATRERMTSRSFRLPSTVSDALDELADDTDRSPSDIAREAIAAAVDGRTNGKGRGRAPCGR